MLAPFFRNVGFHVLWEQSASPEDLELAVRVVLDDFDEWQPPAAVAGDVAAAEAEAHRAAARRGQVLDQSECLGRVRPRPEYPAGADLELDLQPTNYARFAATNLNLRRRLPDGSLHPFAAAVARLRAGAGGGGEDDGDPSTLASQPYLASPLNVIAALVTSDRHLVVPLRGPHVFERPLTLQASVGGAWKRGDEEDAALGPKATLVREAREELGIQLGADQIQFLCFGYNCATGEPDLLALVRVNEDRAAVVEAYRSRGADGAGHYPEVYLLGDSESGGASVVDLRSEAALKYLLGVWRHAELWSQPSDRAAVLAALLCELGPEAVGRAMRWPQ